MKRMYKTITKSKRPAVKESRISEALRRQIVDGTLPPGAQLPKRVELERHFAVSPVTLQRAIQALMDDGFVYAKVGQGTYVADNPPHLSHFALIFPSHPGERSTWTNFYAALDTQALDLQRTRRGALSMYYGLERPEHHDERERLARDVAAHRLAGLIFAYAPTSMRGSPILEQRRVARVAVMRQPMPGISAVTLDGQAPKAIDHLVARGRKRLAIIGAVSQGPAGVAAIQACAAARGIQTESYWCHAVDSGASEWGRNLVQLLCMLPPDKRPDSLFITDDNLVPQCTAGLLAGGLRVPEDIEVVAHGNFPDLTPSVVPAKRVGYDAREVLRSCLEALERQRLGIADSELITVSPKLDHEIEPVSLDF